MKKFIHIKNILSQTIFWSIINLVMISRVFAEVGGGTSGGGCSTSGGLTNPLNSCSFQGIIGNVANITGKVGIPIAAIFIIYSGLLFVTARGSEDQLKKAKTTFMWAIIGTGILLGAWVIAKAITATVQSL